MIFTAVIASTIRQNRIRRDNEIISQRRHRELNNHRSNFGFWARNRFNSRMRRLYQGQIDEEQDEDEENKRADEELLRLFLMHQELMRIVHQRNQETERSQPRINRTLIKKNMPNNIVAKESNIRETVWKTMTYDLPKNAFFVLLAKRIPLAVQATFLLFTCIFSKNALQLIFSLVLILFSFILWISTHCLYSLLKEKSYGEIACHKDCIFLSLFHHVSYFLYSVVMIRLIVDLFLDRQEITSQYALIIFSGIIIGLHMVPVLMIFYVLDSIFYLLFVIFIFSPYVIYSSFWKRIPVKEIWTNVFRVEYNESVLSAAENINELSEIQLSDLLSQPRALPNLSEFEIPYSSSIVHTQACIICLCEYEEGEIIISLRCNQNHVFHKHCLQKWIEVDPMISCPFCKKRIVNSQI